MVPKSSPSANLGRMQTLVHLVRHAEVHNPDNVFYGRMEGFHLSERGYRQAEALAEYFAGHKLEGVYCSPLTRAQETARPIASRHGLEPVLIDDLLESDTRIAGKPGDLRIFRNPLNWRYFMNPLRPSWGEPYPSIRSRMTAVVERIAKEHAGAEAVAVSHMTPILVARLAFDRNPRQPWRAGVPCRRGSVTTLEFEDDKYVRSYYEPVGSSIR